MPSAMQVRRLDPERQVAPPRWVVRIVKCCVIGLLLLPAGALVSLVLYSRWAPADADLGPAPFIAFVVVGLALFTTAACLTGRYPPVPPDARRKSSNASPDSKETSHDE